MTLPIPIKREPPDVDGILNQLRNLVGDVTDVWRMPDGLVRETLSEVAELFATLDTALSAGLGWPTEWVVPHD